MFDALYSPLLLQLKVYSGLLAQPVKIDASSLLWLDRALPQIELQNSKVLAKCVKTAIGCFTGDVGSTIFPILGTKSKDISATAASILTIQSVSYKSSTFIEVGTACLGCQLKYYSSLVLSLSYLSIFLKDIMSNIFRASSQMHR